MPAVQLALDLPAMALLDLSDEERDELARALREMIEGDRFPSRRGCAGSSPSSTAGSDTASIVDVIPAAEAPGEAQACAKEAAAIALNGRITRCARNY